jgi:hypothetical protein
MRANRQGILKRALYEKAGLEGWAKKSAKATLANLSAVHAISRLSGRTLITCCGQGHGRRHFGAFAVTAPDAIF